MLTLVYQQEGSRGQAALVELGGELEQLRHGAPHHTHRAPMGIACEPVRACVRGWVSKHVSE